MSSLSSHQQGARVGVWTNRKRKGIEVNVFGTNMKGLAMGNSAITVTVLFLLIGTANVNAHTGHHHGVEPGHGHKYESEQEHEHEHGHRHEHEHAHEHGYEDKNDCSHSHNEGHAHGHFHSHSGQFHGAEKRFEPSEQIGEEGFQKHLLGESFLNRFQTRTYGLYGTAIFSSVLVSMASLPCVLLVPLIVKNGKPSKAWVDALAGFGAGSMLGDVFLHQLPHAFSAPEEHSHDHVHKPGHEQEAGHAHAHSIEDLSVGLAILGGILLFFVVEKIVRQFDVTAGQQRSTSGHGHHHHHHRIKKDMEGSNAGEGEGEDRAISKDTHSRDLRRRNVKASNELESENGDNVSVRDSDRDGVVDETNYTAGKDTSRLVLGYLNLFSDGVHNFTDGMALGSAFIVRGPVGGWSRTLFLLAHELPQEVGDYGILLSSGFGIFEALTFNFLSALMALAGTILALLAGGDSLNSSLIEAFTAGGFIYIAVGSVMPDMHSQGASLKITVSQVTAMIFGIGVAVAISLAE